MLDLQPGLEELLRQSPVVAVLMIEDVSSAVPLARALVAGGIRLIEITLRTPEAREAISLISAEVEEAVVGAGTILAPSQFGEVEKLKCRFAVSPGSTPELLKAASQARCPWLPGAATVSEMMRLFEQGFALQKFFPAEAMGGIAFLKSVAAVLRDIRFCPTGGIDERNVADYLALPNVLCVGGSWVAPPALVKARRWDEIATRAASAASTRRG
jgi:2-dehydro-3-deoxyphosphogluconate aldolase / (4S)-4-hydroxy-2-oxoglutarate aldolase